MNFIEYISLPLENSEYKIFDTFREKVENDFKRYFPNGYISLSSYRNIGKPEISVEFGLVQDEHDLKENKRNNDPMFHNIILKSKDKKLNKENIFKMKILRSNIIIKENNKINFNEYEYTFFNIPKTIHKVKKISTFLRVSEGNLEVIENKLNNYFNRLSKYVVEKYLKTDFANNLNEKYLIINVSGENK